MTPTIILTDVHSRLSTVSNWGAFSLADNNKYCLLGAILVGAGHDPIALGSHEAYMLFETEQTLKDTVTLVHQAMWNLIPYKVDSLKSSSQYMTVSFVNDHVKTVMSDHNLLMEILDESLRLAKAA